ncbi:MAG: DUF3217 domain-containing protein [Mycoplasmataceae bacterium]|jgi:RPA family protein|nr:DUF3217 domain-containing protein [Mycoplasmataceae bacterium]
MLNKVIIEGIVARSQWGKEEKKCFFVTIKQERKVNNYTWASYFSLFANQPVADQLAEIVEKNQNAHITVEGSLKTYRAKDNTYKTTIQVEKIIPNETK